MIQGQVFVFSTAENTEAPKLLAAMLRGGMLWHQKEERM